MCFGVRDALATAERLAARGPLTILGELVHNPLVRERLAARGVGEATLDTPPNAAASTVMVTAHGASGRDLAAWRDAGRHIEDGTCPLVRLAHGKLARLVGEGFHPVVIGRRGHVEVRGLTGDHPGAVVIEEEADAALLPPDGTPLGVVSQTTQPAERVARLLEAIRLARPSSPLRFVDTVCQPTKDRQRALHALLQECDAVVVIGGRGSHNTRQLAAAAEAAGARAWHVERVEELDAAWLIGARAVGVTAGTSTLPETVDAVVARLHEITAGKEDAQ